ncbi:ribosomal protein subunit L11 [Schizosaccharomyces cryophilus OY26]|uniref:Ribosomal protein subunit L11 n=1 Tax=Schizosaccharomyces cryophilus (strain OY26 / ATCC MYA-4695 / CBS 11777 / NBRC 106824 / NRRL Y48691) TaxID=653667 RepID=S9XIJ7_SCHCR|nr:ribosomal protein subunit L11 [Schizosaccharomyces cryophilus OY26]EPY53476.1 ribosomal protein subunit L11 [Schizosaccharomyces cryophilus OY26]
MKCSMVARAALKSFKSPELRKSVLHSQYVALLQESPNFLLLQHNNLLPSESRNLRNELKSHAPNGNLKIISNSIFRHALHVYDSLPKGADGSVDLSKANDISSNKNANRVKLDIDDLFVGPLAIFALGPDVAPESIRGCLSALKRFQNKMVLLGGRLESEGMDFFQVESISKIPSHKGLQASLLSLLSHPSQQLKQLLDMARGNVAYTLERRED